MSLEEVIVDELATVLGHQRIFPLSLPQGQEYPAVVYQRISEIDDHTHDGTSLVRCLYQFACWGASASQAFATARAVQDYYEAQIGRSYIENVRDSGLEAGPKKFRRDVDVRICVPLSEVVAGTGS